MFLFLTESAQGRFSLVVVTRDVRLWIRLSVPLRAIINLSLRFVVEECIANNKNNNNGVGDR